MGYSLILDTSNKYYVYIKENSETELIKGILISSIELENGEKKKAKEIIID